MYKEPQTLHGRVEELYRERIVDYLLEREESILREKLEKSQDPIELTISRFRMNLLNGSTGYFNLMTENLEEKLAENIPPSHWLNETFASAVVHYASEFPEAMDSLKEALHDSGYKLIEVKETEKEGEKKMATLTERLMFDLKQAMKNKDTSKKGTITLIRSGLQTAEKEKKAPLTEAEEVAILQRELKQNRQAVVEAEKAGRQDIVDLSNEKIKLIESYLPEMMTEEEIVSFLEGKGVQKGDNIGKIMGLLMKDNKGKVDGSLAKEVIQKHFA